MIAMFQPKAFYVRHKTFCWRVFLVGYICGVVSLVILIGALR